MAAQACTNLLHVALVAHNARFDEWVLRDAGLRAAPLIDTLRLARACLRLPSYRLKDVAGHLLGISLDKSLQKSNWRRPLTKAQLSYAATDALVTLRVYQQLHRIMSK